MAFPNPKYKGLKLKRIFQKKHQKKISGQVTSITLDFIEWQITRDLGAEKTTEKIVLSDGKSFFRDYTDFIAQTAPEMRGNFWTASEIACRYRFNTEIPKLLTIFDHVIAALREGSFTKVEVISDNISWVESITHNAPDTYHLIEPGNSYGLRNTLSNLKTGLRLILSQARSGLTIWVRGLLARKLIPGIKDSNRENYLVIKSFSYLHSFGEHYVDPFFNELPRTLKEKGYQVLILTKIFTDFRSILECIRNQKVYEILPLEYFLRITDICKSYAIFLKSRYRFEGKIFWRGSNVAHMLNAELKRRVFDLRLENIVHYFANRRLLADYAVKQYLYTYENMPWEKFTLRALRERSPAPVLIAYQHSVIPQNAANNYVSQYEAAEEYADYILTTGRVTARLIAQHSSSRSAKILAFCALRYNYLYSISSMKRKQHKKPVILIALEGVRPAGPLVDYVVNEMRNETDYDIVFRFHPILPYDKMLSSIRHDPLKYKHMRISTHKLVIHDLQECDALIYWGSTVALEGIMCGLPVIHYHMPMYFNFDPLYDLQANKYTVSAEGDLSRCLARIFSGISVNRKRLAESARKYINEYFFPVTPARIRDLTGILESTTGSN